MAARVRGLTASPEPGPSQEGGDQRRRAEDDEGIGNRRVGNGGHEADGADAGEQAGQDSGAPDPDESGEKSPPRAKEEVGQEGQRQQHAAPE